MNDDEIRNRVHIIVNGYSKGVKLKEEDAVVINAGVDLIVNFFNCLNIIANKRSN